MKWRFWVSGIMCMVLWLADARSQDQEEGDVEKYLKSNIAFGNGRVLGISDTRYARCIEAVDYADPGRKIISVEIDGVEYADDGKGFDPTVKRKGIGITNMSSRAKLLNGDLQILSAPGMGCTLTISIPIVILNGVCYPVAEDVMEF